MDWNGLNFAKWEKKTNYMRYLVLVLTSIFILNNCQSTQTFKEKRRFEPFAVSYEQLPSVDQSPQNYNLLIVESDHYTKAQVDTLKQHNKNVLAYISLGEVNKNRWYYPLLEEQGFLGTNENWDSPYLNLADSTTRAILLDRVIPNIMKKGFDGLFLDTVDDVAPYTKRSHLQPYMVDLIRQINRKHAQTVIIQNAGLFLLDKTHSLVDGVLVEDVATSYDFKNNRYRLRPKDSYRERVNTLNGYKAEYNLPFLVVDFANTESLKKMAVSRLDTVGMPYYIGGIGLNNISKGHSSRSN